MWQTFRRSDDTDSRSSLGALLHSTIYRIIIVVWSLWGFWHFLFPLGKPISLLGVIWAISLAVAASSLVSLLLLRHFPFIVQLVWMITMLWLLTLVAHIFRQPEALLFFPLFPLLAILTLSWGAATLIQILIITATIWLGADSGSNLLTANYAGIVIFSSTVALGIGGIVRHAIHYLIEWYIYSYAQAQAKVREAQQHRAQLYQLFQDLDRAYYRLDRANAQLVAARAAAEAVERFKTEFVTNVSHELRTPLNLIVGFTEMMTTSPESYDGVQLPGPYRSDINTVNRSAQHLLELVDDVLDLARIETGRLSLTRERVNLEWLLNDTISIVRDYITAKGLELQLHVHDNIPDLWIDRLRIRQVLLNLLVNAARHTAQGFIRIELQRVDDEVMIRIRDSGQGIAKEDIERIWEEFRSTEQPYSEWHSGTGLGLPISRKFVELHHGRIGVESTLGQGTTFWITLPYVQLAETELAQNGSLAADRGRPSRYQPVVQIGSPERILVVVHEDEHIAMLLRRYLNSFQVLRTAGVAEAVQLCEEVRAVGIVLDSTVQVPNLPPDLLVIQLPLPSLRVAAQTMGVTALLVKPVSQNELFRAIDQLPTSPQHALIVDDDPDIVRLFQRMLRAYPTIKTCVTAHNGEEALQLMHKAKPDLVLLDLVMPKVDGDSFLHQMSKLSDFATLPVILISAKGQDHYQPNVTAAIRISKVNGLELGETVRALGALLDALTPGWEHLGAKEPVLPAMPVG